MKIEAHYVRHAVAIAGIVRDAVSQARIGRALIEIKHGPPKFQAKVNTLSCRPGLAQPCRTDRPHLESGRWSLLFDGSAGWSVSVTGECSRFAVR